MLSEDLNKRINYLEIPVTDIESAKAFFAAVFDWSFVDYGPQYAAFNDGAMDGGLSLQTEKPAMGGALIVFFAVDLEAMLAQVKANGGHIVKDIFSFPGGRRFHFQDPAKDGEYAVWSDRGLEAQA